MLAHASRATSALKAAVGDAAVGDAVNEPADKLQSVFAGFIADVTNTPAAGLTAADVRDCSFADDLVERTFRFLEGCEASRYGAPGAVGDDAPAEAESLLNDIISEARRRKLC